MEQNGSQRKPTALWYFWPRILVYRYHVANHVVKVFLYDHAAQIFMLHTCIYFRFSHFAKAGGEAYMMGNFANASVSDADKIQIVVSMEDTDICNLVSVYYTQSLKYDKYALCIALVIMVVCYKAQKPFDPCCPTIME